jgi:hypothetical protein
MKEPKSWLGLYINFKLGRFCCYVYTGTLTATVENFAQ